MQCAVLSAVCALIIGVYARSAKSGLLESLCSGAQDSYYNLLVQGFRAGQLNLKAEVPPGLAQLADPYDPAASEPYRFNYEHPLQDISYYKGKLYLYFGITPALVLFWPYAVLTGHYLLQKDAVLLFFSMGFLVGTGVLLAAWKRYFATVSFWIIVPCIMALGLANFAPAILAGCDVYEVAISCGYAMTMVALAGIWGALHQPQWRGRWLAAASLAYGLALGARPSLLLGAVILLVPVAQAWREKQRVWPLLMAATVPIVLIGLGLMFYNDLRFDNPLDFGQHYQLSSTRQDTMKQFSPRYLWSNFLFGYLEPAGWSGHFPFVHDSAHPPSTSGTVPDNSFGVLTNIPLLWLALAAPLAWRRRSAKESSILRWFLAAVALLFGVCALTMGLYFYMCLRYEVEFTHTLALLAVIGILGLERALASQPAWRRTARCGWGLLLVFSVAFNLFANFHMQAQTHNNLGFFLLKDGREDDAITQFRKVLELDPDFPLARHNLGMVLDKTGRVDEAIVQYQRTLEIKPNDVDAQNNLGIALLKKGRADEAINHFQQILQINPAYAEAQYNLGNAFWDKRMTDEAIAHFRKALEINPGYADALINLGTLLYGQGKLDEAIALFQQALQLRPNYAEAHYNLGLSLLQKGKVDEAILHFQAAVQIKPGSASFQFNLGLAFFRKGNMDEAIVNFQKALQIKPAYMAAHYNLGKALLQEGRVDEAIPHFQTALQIAPNSAEVYNSLGTALLQKGAVDEAIVQFQKALQIKPAYATAHYNLGNAFFQKGGTAEAIRQYQQALQISPADADAQNNLAWILATCAEPSLRNGRQAVDLAQKANEIYGGTNPFILHTLAAAFAEAGQFADAKRAVQKAVELAQTAGKQDLVEQFNGELKRYEAGLPCRE